MSIRIARAIPLVSVALAAALAFAGASQATKPWKLEAPAPLADEIQGEIDGWKDIDCARCHAIIAQEWAGSRHALAWVNARYTEQLADMKRPESCHGCHAPEPLFLATSDGKPPQKPKARDLAPQAGPKRELDAHFGVTCSSCHLGRDGAMLGPFGAPTRAHASRKEELFLAEGGNAACIACHATNVGPVIGIGKDLAEASASKDRLGCVDCHMQPVERAIAAEEGEPPLAPRAGRSHALQTPRDPAFLRRALSITAGVRDGGVVVVVRNECGHRVPGLVGRRLDIEAVLLDGSGSEIAKGKLEIETRQSLPRDGALEIALAPKPGVLGVRVKLKGLHDAPGFDAPAAFLDETIDVGK